MEVVITWYNDTMQEQVINMFEIEYKIDKSHFEKLFKNFYFHPFQKNKVLLVVALDGNIVAGFQSFFYWPYVLNGKTLNSFQSGNSLVHPNYRGKGIFQKMLAFIDRENKTIGVDLLMGFPVEASLKIFIKDKWQNSFNLKWYLKVGNPFAFFNTSLENKNGFEKGLKENRAITDNKLRLSSQSDFVAWRENYLDKNLYFSFTYQKGKDQIVFHLKKNKRKKVINELVIGKVLFDGEKPYELLEFALAELIFKTRLRFHFISIAINEESDILLKQQLEKLSFKKTDKSIYFIVKPFTNSEFFIDPKNWITYRSDIDTW